MQYPGPFPQLNYRLMFARYAAMPGYKTHLFGGLLFGGAALFAAVWFGLLVFEPGPTAALLVIAALAALFPDVDTNSKGQHLFYILLAGADIALMVKEQYRWAAILGFFAMLPAIGNHRGWTHTWWAALLVPAPIVALPMAFYAHDWRALLPFYLAAVVGYLSHLAFDRTW